MNQPVSASPQEIASLSISDETPAILIDEPQKSSQEEKQDIPKVCHAGNGWCKNVCKEGQSICDECTNMMDSYP